MIVYTTTGIVVSIINENGRSLFDSNGVEWARYPKEDTQDPFGCAYRETKTTWPLYSPTIAKIEVVREGKVRRAKLNYIKARVGKAAKVRELVK